MSDHALSFPLEEYHSYTKIISLILVVKSVLSLTFYQIDAKRLNNNRDKINRMEYILTEQLNKKANMQSYIVTMYKNSLRSDLRSTFSHCG